MRLALPDNTIVSTIYFDFHGNRNCVGPGLYRTSMYDLQSLNNQISNYKSKFYKNTDNFEKITRTVNIIMDPVCDLKYVWDDYETMTAYICEDEINSNNLHRLLAYGLGFHFHQNQYQDSVLTTNSEQFTKSDKMSIATYYKAPVALQFHGNLIISTRVSVDDCSLSFLKMFSYNF